MDARHASGSPQRDGNGSSATGPLDVQWVIASDEGLQQVVARGTAQAAMERDFTVKVDAGGLGPGRTYHYAFVAGGERSPVGRTKTLPERTDRLRVASVSCSNYPAGYFNVYRCIANRPDLDAVIHLGDYIYEFANGRYGDGSASGRVPLRAGEASTLEDYRDRYATYRSDIDLQEAHRRHPFIAVWDDHESANDAWSGGAGNHNPSQGSWATRLAGAYRAYLEWMPIRESSDPKIHLYRSFRFGDLADLVMLDTRGLRDQQAIGTDAKMLADPSRSLLGAAQEAWFFDQLRASQRARLAVARHRPADPVHAARRLPASRSPTRMCGTATRRRATASSTCSPARRSPTSRSSPATSTARGRWMSRGIRGRVTTRRPAPARLPWSS